MSAGGYLSLESNSSGAIYLNERKIKININITNKKVTFLGKHEVTITLLTKHLQ